MIDTHTHLYSEQFDADRDASIAAAVAEGVRQFVLPNVDRASFKPMMEVCARHPSVCFPCVGLHPTSVDGSVDDEVRFVEEQLARHRFTAVGEIGIDCHWSVEHLDEQRWAFERQVGLALEHGLPIVIHAREAFGEVFALLDRLHTDGCRGVFHSFSGSLADYRAIKRYGTFKVGLGGVMTFKNSRLSEVVGEMDLADIVLETDAPYLSPHPFRGQRNESARLVIIARKLAEIKGCSLEEVDEVTTENARGLFGLPD